MVQTPLDGAAREEQRQELKAAIGAESMSPPVRPALRPIDRLRANLTPRPRSDFQLSLDPRARLREAANANAE